MTRLIIIDDAVPPESCSLLQAAADARGIETIVIDAPGFGFDAEARLLSGDLVYRAGVSAAALRVEQFLHGPGVASFYMDPEGVFFHPGNYQLLFQRHGLPVPRTLPLVSADRDGLRRAVERLGGLPLVVKVGGGEGGVGTLRADSLAALFALADHLLARGEVAMLCTFVDDAVHWRVVVVGSRAVAAYRNPSEVDDFRSHGSSDAADFTDSPAPALAALAIAAVRALRLEFGGVDILIHATGRLYLLEANFPCYFAHAELVAGIPVAAAMIDHLLGKRRPED